MMETGLSAFVLGPLLTSFTLGAYFGDPLFYHYFINMLGEPQYHLPGLFTTNPEPLVNGQLWTVPFELGCYVAIAGVGILGGRKNRWIAPASAVAVLAIYFLARLVHWHGMPDIHRAMPGPMLIAAFLVGVSVYLYRDQLPGSHRAGFVSLVISLVALALPGAWQFIAAVSVAYFAAYAGTLNPERRGVLRTADYSYGLYLYGNPIEQSFVRLFPTLHNWPITATVGIVVSTAFAAFSWHVVEKPAMALRGPLNRLEKWWLSVTSGKPKVEATTSL